MPGSVIDEVKVIVGGGIAAIAAGIALLVRGSKARAQVSGDALTVAENASKSARVEDRDEMLATERELRLAAEARERDLFAEVQRLEATLSLYRAHSVRLERKLNKLAEFVAKTHPEIAGWATTEPAEFDAEPKGR